MSRIDHDHIKFCARVQNTSDMFRLMDLFFIEELKDISFTVIGTGDKGAITRLLFPLLGSRLKYCFIMEAWNELLGQVSLKDIKDFSNKYRQVYSYSKEEKLTFANDIISSNSWAIAVAA